MSPASSSVRCERRVTVLIRNLLIVRVRFRCAGEGVCPASWPGFHEVLDCSSSRPGMRRQCR